MTNREAVMKRLSEMSNEEFSALLWRRGVTPINTYGCDSVCDEWMNAESVDNFILTKDQKMFLDLARAVGYKDCCSVNGFLTVIKHDVPGWGIKKEVSPVLAPQWMVESFWYQIKEVLGIPKPQYGELDFSLD